MKSEELYLVFSSFFLGMLAVGVSVCMNKLFHPLAEHYSTTYYDIFALVFWGFSIYFALKYTGIISRGKRNDK